MTISTPLTSRAKKQKVVIQCVTRTRAACRGEGDTTGATAAELGRQADSLTARWYHVERTDRVGRTLLFAKGKWETPY